ncbi:MAG: ABC transporter ATP-binding protein [Erysipelotrichaceae bacterium]|jgi:ABC-type lipoprotein export system ATPase subunit|nr:ABC transporter ATP-binding protein [Erysipelotrichaceae bacterium]
MIVLRNVNRIYGKGENAVHALKDINLVIEDGKFTAILGKSGSGKTTLMNIIGAIDTPTSGKVYSGDVDLSSLSENKLAEYRNKSTGFVFQSFYLEPSYTVLENVAMPLTIAGMKRKEREELAKDIIAKLGLEDKTYKKANELSGGQKQRVSIARALVHNPAVILADEPTGNLDSQNGAEVMALLKEIVKTGKSVVLVTHNMEDAKNAENIINIKDGVISAEYMNKYKFKDDISSEFEIVENN